MPTSFLTTNGITIPYNGLVYAQQSVVTVANSVTETTLLSQPLSFPAHYIRAGGVVKFKAWGIHSATANPNLRFRLKYGSTVILDGNGNTQTSTNQTWCFDAEVVCLSVGTSGNFIVAGYYTETVGPLEISMTTGLTPIQLDTTVAASFDFTVQWGAQNPANTFSCLLVRIDALQN